MKIAYIAHPISGDIEGNLERIRKIVRKINLDYPDIVPFVPYYVDIVSLDDTNIEERKRGMANDTAILENGMVDEIWLYGDRISNGMHAEIIIARRKNIPVIAMSNEIKELFWHPAFKP